MPANRPASRDALESRGTTEERPVSEADPIPRPRLYKIAHTVRFAPRSFRRHRTRARGRLQVQVRRAFIGHNVRTTSQVYDYALPRVRADLWRQMQRCSVLRVLDQLCHRVGRDLGAIIWKLKEPLE